MTTEQRTCPTPHCGRPSPTTKICHHCVHEARTALQQFTYAELDRLHAIALGEEQSADTTARSDTPTTGPTDPIDLPTWHLHRNLETTWPNLLPTLHKNPDAKDLHHQILTGCDTAQRKINGPRHEWAPGDIQAATKQLATPMPTTTLIQWMWDTFRIRLTPGQIRNWTWRGKLTPATGQGHEHKTYRPKDIISLLD